MCWEPGLVWIAGNTAVNKQGGPALMVLMAKSQEDRGGR